MRAKKNITLSDGVEITVDSSSLLQKEFRGFFDPRVSDKASDKVMARLSGVKVDYIEGLLRDDYRRLLDTIIELANRPLSDPNSQSESSSG